MPNISIDDLLSTLLKLYHSGAYPCLVIAAAFFGLRYASQHVAWLEQPKQRAYMTAALTALAMLVPTALAGTTPNLGQIISAITAAALAYISPATPPKPETPGGAGSAPPALAKEIAVSGGLAKKLD